ncbi:YigZ family protein [Acetoanaerobium sticklandii]|uniref:YigZ family protein n=1 Tax=Acetoanaerobium sticklandii TaxID=1511 RepID=UPI003A937EC2
MNEYKTVFESGESTIIIEKSKFIGYSRHVETEEDALTFINEIKKKNKDATHNVSAYILGEKKNAQKYSDDGEPSGTAGIPILELMKKEELTNSAIVVTRYFGGIKLGAGGLVRAYSKSAKSTLENSLISQKKIFIPIEILFDYSYLGKIQNDISTRNILASKPDFEDVVKYTIYVDKEEIDSSINHINDLTSGNAIIDIKDEVLLDFVNDNYILL